MLGVVQSEMRAEQIVQEGLGRRDAPLTGR